MLDPENIDFEKLGFHAGLEVHHQLNTKQKLFCHCPAELDLELQKRPQFTFQRRFRAVLGEMGDYDPGMLVEVEKGYLVKYHADNDHVCTYEMDETPPFWPNDNAIDIGIQLAYLFHCKSHVDELVVNRKQYLDGSITTGFQRTMIVARDGYVELKSGKKVRIANILVEEDAARKIKTENRGRTVYYNLDRLGIPLTEIITKHNDISTPEELVETAKMIGLNVRAAKLVKRGIGSVRQDVNLSIRGGDRAELKGVQDLSMLPTYCAREVCRQHALIEIKNALKQRDIDPTEFTHTYIDVSDLFSTLTVHECAYAVRLPHFEDLLLQEVQPGKDFGMEIFEKCSLITGLQYDELFHSGEIQPMAIRAQKKSHQLFIRSYEDQQIRKALQLKDNDAYIVAKGPKNRVHHALKKAVERAKQAFDGVPKETRRVLANGNNEFLRVIHGKERLYPDTDTPPLPINEERRRKFENKQYQNIAEIYNKYRAQGLTIKQLSCIIREEMLEVFQTALERDVSVSLAFYGMYELPTNLRREGYGIDQISNKIILDSLIAVEQQLIPHSFLKNLYQKYCEVGSDIARHNQILKHFSDNTLPTEKLKAMVKRELASYEKTPPKQYIMGDLMNKYNRQIDGHVLAEIVEEELQ